MTRVNKTELGEILGLKNLRRLSLEEIEERLLKKNYILKKVEKVGRQMIYTLEYQEQEFNVNNFVEEKFKVRDGEKFIKHTSFRVDSIKNQYPLSAESIGGKIDIPGRTCRNWDDKLEEAGIISKNEKDYLYYFKYPTGETIQVTKEIYDNYCRANRVILLEIQDLYNRLDNQDISRRYFEVNYDALKDKLIDGIRAYKLHEYELNELNNTYNLIKDYLNISFVNER